MEPTRETLAHWEPRFHLTPGQGWLNDPNGLCQYLGTYHFYYQYGPGWPEDGTKWWGHATSTDLLTWERTEPVLAPTLAEDRNGVWSGCALVPPDSGRTADAVSSDDERTADIASSDSGRTADTLRIFYTGHVVPEGAIPHTAYDHMAYQITAASADGMHFEDRHVLLGPDDYPDEVCAHVRDPKVWRETDGSWWMLLGTRLVVDESKMGDIGTVMLWRSSDGESWEFDHYIRSTQRLGYMWECPNLVRLGGYDLGSRDFLAVCPQGLRHEELRWQNRWQAGYFALPQCVRDTYEVDASGFVEWDHGFDFYAPQTFVDDRGRTVLVGWMGTFDPTYSSAPEGLTWCHCLTLPRELTMAADGSLLQWPVEELDERRGPGDGLVCGKLHECPGMQADIVLSGIMGTGRLMLGDTAQGGLLAITYDGGRLSLAFTEDAGAAALGRTHRTIACETLSDLRVIVDGSTVEVYANQGAQVFSTRWFPADTHLALRSDFQAEGIVYQLRV